MYTMTLQELLFYSFALPIMLSAVISWGGYYWTKYRLRKYREKREAGTIKVGTEVKMHTGEHEGKEGVVFGLITVESENGKNTEAAVLVECGCALLAQPLSNLEKLS